MYPSGLGCRNRSQMQDLPDPFPSFWVLGRPITATVTGGGGGGVLAIAMATSAYVSNHQKRRWITIHYTTLKYRLPLYRESIWIQKVQTTRLMSLKHSSLLIRPGINLYWPGQVGAISSDYCHTICSPLHFTSTILRICSVLKGTLHTICRFQ